MQRDNEYRYFYFVQSVVEKKNDYVVCILTIYSEKTLVVGIQTVIIDSVTNLFGSFIHQPTSKKEEVLNRTAYLYKCMSGFDNSFY